MLYRRKTITKSNKHKKVLKLQKNKEYIHYASNNIILKEAILKQQL